MKQAEEGRIKRPYKVWDSGRQIRKGLVASSFAELIDRGREKLDFGEARVRVVLETDGTQVEDPEYFTTLPENTVFLLLRQGEHWYPAGVEVLRQGSSPRKPSATARVIVSGVGESTTQRYEYLSTQPSFGSTPSPIPGSKSPVPSVVGATTHLPGTVTTIHKDGKKETLINDVGTAGGGPSHTGTVINHDTEHKNSYVGAGAAGVMVGRLSRQGSSVESAHSATVHIHTPECCAYGHPTPTLRSRVSPTGDQFECDFHCCSLHEEGGRIQASRQYAHQQVHLPKQSSYPGALQEKKHVPTVAKIQHQHSDDVLLTSKTVTPKHVHIQPTVQIQKLPHRKEQQTYQKISSREASTETPQHLESKQKQEQYYQQKQHLQQLQQQLHQQQIELQNIQGQQQLQQTQQLQQPKPKCKIHEQPCHCC